MDKSTALGAVLEDAVPVLTKIAERLCKNAVDAADLVHDVIERAIEQGLPGDVKNPHAWLTQIMKNLFIDRCRAASRAPVHEPLDETHDNVTPITVDVQEPAWSRATIDDVHAALETIDPPFREVYVLHTFQHLTYEEIATRLKISRFTVGTRLTRTRRMLRRQLLKRLGREKP